MNGSTDQEFEDSSVNPIDYQDKNIIFVRKSKAQRSKSFV